MPFIENSGGGGGGGGGSGTVTNVSSADTSIAVATATTTPVLTVAALNTIAANHATSGSVAMNSNKLTGLAAGSGAGDSIRYEQVFAAGAVPIADIADPTTGKVIGSSGGAAAAVLPPGFEIGYDQVTSTVTVASATEASGTTVISCAAHTFDGSPVMCEFFCPQALLIHSADALTVSLFEGATQIGRLAQTYDEGTGAIDGYPITGRLRFTPTAASHTYTVTAYAGTGAPNNTLVCGAGGTGAFVPMFCRFTKV